jgi:AmmeMemoRadiSam system protein A
MRSANNRLSGPDRTTLLAIARRSIEHGLQYGRKLQIDAQDYPDALRTCQASFVTLHLQQQLRGCIGALQASLPLVRDVAEHAFAAAFEDPRFAALTSAEFSPALTVHISVLSPSEPLECHSEAELLNLLRPGVDGLTLHYRQQRGTFLPAVWENVPEPREFLAHLKQKAGLDKNFWSDEMRFERYTTESFP